MVPNGWTLNNFNSVAELIHGFQFREHHFSESGVPIVKIASISHLRGVSLEKCSYISEELASEFSKYQIEAGDVLMALTGGTLGKTCKVQEDIELCLQNYRVGNFKPKPNFLDKDFLYYFLISFTVQKRIENIVNEAAQPNVGKADFDKIKVLTPPLPEQRKIAKILSTWDKAISNIERLIGNSKLQKKALMQQLLNGKKRLLDESGKEFKGDWIETKLGDVLKIGGGKDYKHLSEGNVPVYGSGGHMLYVSDYLYDGESVCIGRKGTIDQPMFLSGKFWTVDTLFYTHSFKNTIPKFIYQYFLTIHWRRYSEASGVPSLSKSIIEKIKIKLPPLIEQQKIAQVLTNADKEIELLEQQLADLKQEKKALMQQLITGKRRVKV
ncbi:restriction endonuclease subunit S [Pseudoalteromonas shioyasakiensis]|uniref:restriction endonuclease subunit S n=1 Tax=Pseudoalteromonas shioyasakiensis TaxID=1190813 RepID=UPI001C3E1929|nr:restriction endonuclease subunit S [Pseudoalteromonas shioyasakiensis]